MYTPENRPLDSFYADQPERQHQGAFLRSEVVLPCWHREPTARLEMAQIVELLSSEFKDFQVQ